MRGKQMDQASMFYAMDLNEMVPADHPLRPIKAEVDRQLAGLEEVFEGASSRTGRPSVPPERLLKALVLQCLYSIARERVRTPPLPLPDVAPPNRPTAQPPHRPTAFDSEPKIPTPIKTIPAHLVLQRPANPSTIEDQAGINTDQIPGLILVRFFS